MDIRNNLPPPPGHFSPYTSSSYGAADGTPGARRSAQLGDSLTMMAQPAEKSRLPKTTAQLEKSLRNWKGVRTGVGVVLLLSLALFSLFLLEPVLVFLFTLGGCFSGGCEEWLEFASEALYASLIPGTIALASLFVVILANFFVFRINDELQTRIHSIVTVYPAN